MEIQNTIVQDNGNLVRDILTTDKELVPVCVNLPDYLDVTSLLALQKRMADAAEVTGKKLRLVAHTDNLQVEKYATRIFAGRDDIYLSIDWRAND